MCIRDRIWCIVKRFYGRGAEPEDLFQIGSIGLLKAIAKFDIKVSDISFDKPINIYACEIYGKEQGLPQ